MVRALILLVLGWLIVAASPPQQQRGQPNGIPRDPAANSLQNGAAATAERENQTEGYTADCEQGRDNRRSDLCAQWKAADAASEAAGWAGWTWWLGVGGVMIGLGTLGAAAAAAWYARQAAIHTGAQVEVSRDAAKRQLRAYVSLRFIGFQDFDDPDRSLTYSIGVTNAGQTPALQYTDEWDCSIMVGAQFPPDLIPVTQLRTNLSDELGPGQTNRWIKRPFRVLTADEIQAIKGRNAFIVIRGLIMFRDVFGEKYLAAVAYANSFPINGQMKSLYHIELGDDGEPKPVQEDD